MKVLSPTTTTKFYAISRQPSSSELRSLLVDAPSIPGNPIATRLQLIVERHDAFARVPLEGYLLDYSARKVAERAEQEATSRIPSTAKEATLVLTDVLSEGPVDENGCCPSGWTFNFVDGALGVNCQATVTAEEMLLIYSTAVSYPKINEFEWLRPQKALRAVKEAFPQLSDSDLQIRFELPADYHVFRRHPFFVVGVDPERESAIGVDLVKPQVDPDPLPEVPTVPELLKLLGGEEVSDLKTELLEDKPETISAIAEQLLTVFGPTVVDKLQKAVAQADEGNEVVGRCLLRLLSRVPNSLSLFALHRLSTDLSGPLQSLAFNLFEKRRLGELGVSADPFEALEFEESRELLGKEGLRKVALRSTYDPEGTLLSPLETAGLKTTRIRRLSGDTELFLAAYLTSSDRRTEAILASSPLPVPCLIMRIVGADGERLEERVKALDLVYPTDEIINDVLNGRPSVFHRGALYMAAMAIDAPETFDVLAAGMRIHRTNLELRRACLAALGHLSHEGVTPLLEQVDEPELMELVGELLARRKQRPVREDGPKCIDAE